MEFIVLFLHYDISIQSSLVSQINALALFEVVIYSECDLKSHSEYVFISPDILLLQ